MEKKLNSDICKVLNVKKFSQAEKYSPQHDIPVKYMFDIPFLKQSSGSQITKKSRNYKNSEKQGELLILM